MDVSHLRPEGFNQSATGVDPRVIWEGHRAEITELYAVKTLQEVRDEMETRHGFKATTKQWKTYLSKWNLNRKYIRPAIYRAMVRIKREREEDEPQKETQFFLEGVEVNPKKLALYEKRAKKNKGLNGRQGDALTPPGLTCRTPPILHDNPFIHLGGVGSPSACQDALMSPCRDVISARITRSPSTESFDWWNEYIQYDRSMNSTPKPPANKLIGLMLDYQEPLHNYEEECAYKSYFKDRKLECSLYFEPAVILAALITMIPGPDDEERVQIIQRIGRWARATVHKFFQLDLDDLTNLETLPFIAIMIGRLFIALQEIQQAVKLLKHAIPEMSRFGKIRVLDRVIAFFFLAFHGNEFGNELRNELGIQTRVLELQHVLIESVYFCRGLGNDTDGSEDEESSLETREA